MDNSGDRATSTKVGDRYVVYTLTNLIFIAGWPHILKQINLL